MDFTVMTFNLRFDNPADGSNAWPHRVDQVAQAISASGADLVGTQEGLFHMVTDLADRLPAYGWLGQGRRGGMQDEFCAIFYKKERLRAVEVGHFWLSETPDVPGSQCWNSACPRMSTWVRFECRERPGRQFLLFNTHLDHHSQAARERGISLVWETLATKRQQTDLPALLTGDLNVNPGNVVIDFLRARMQDAYATPAAGAGEPGATCHGFTGAADGAPIDYIFGTGGLVFSGTRVDRETRDGRLPSDHFPVISQVRLT